MTASLKTRPMAIAKLDFDAVGKISITLDDGRVLIVPLKYFPELKRLPKEKRMKYTIVDDRTVLFRYSDNVYHLEDFLGLEGSWRER
jgi:hypothetical protein